MMKHMKGRNLAHPGCLTGLTIGVTVGIILGGILALYANLPLDAILWIWLAFSVVFSAIGWIWGSMLTKKYRLLEEQVVDSEPVS